MKMKYLLLTALALFPMLSAQVTTPEFIDYQGTVFDAATGAPLGSAGVAPDFTAKPTNYTMQFKVFGSESGADLIWAETQTVTVSLGLFSVRLGSGAEIADLNPGPDVISIADAFDGSDRFLELTVLPTGSNTGNAITPRLKFQSAPFAFTANRAALADEVIGKVTATTGSSFAGGSFTDGSFSGGTFTSGSFTSGSFTGGTFAGNGAGLTDLDASEITTGTLNKDRIPGLDTSKITTGKLAAALFPDSLQLTGLNVSGTAYVKQLSISDRILVPAVEFWGGRLHGGLFKQGSTGTYLGSTSAETGEMVLSGVGGSLHLQTGSGASAITIDTSNHVGIGAAPTKGVLHVAGFVNDDSYFSGPLATIVNFRELNKVGEITRQWVVGASDTLKASIYAEANVVASIFYAISDSRVKRIEGPSDSARDLDTILGIEVTDYSFIDTLSKGTGTQKKVIAQQVEKVFPQAVSQSTDVIPDIFQQASIQDGWVTLATNLKKGERVRLLGEKNEKGVYEVLEIAEGKFRTEFKPATDKVFVYGREVDDFRTVDYEAISMLNVSATQQVKKELDAVKAENVELKSRLAALEVKDKARDARLSAIEANDQARDAKLTVLMERLSSPVSTAVRTTGYSNVTEVAR